eukprot:TRINITY_DN63094_c0_g1_i1.p1 TRINITY_DN63094_c0_g1~~TRINITY_DN63094_c0_g1_i1.p1  ORF type:complete len:696 (-),score=96.72 TRINITY_DN63094_c0_g1_i1:247-2334(-)
MCSLAHLVSIEGPGGPLGTGVALVDPAGKSPLVLTTADFDNVYNDLVVHFINTDPCHRPPTCSDAAAAGLLASACVPVVHTANARILGAETAFEKLGLRGWTCGAARHRGPRATFGIQVFRATSSVPDNVVERLNCTVLPMARTSTRASHDGAGGEGGNVDDDALVGHAVSVLAAAPFGASSRLVPAVVETHGIICNASQPPGLLLLDAKRLERPAGSAVLLRDEDGSESSHLVACLLSPLGNYQNEIIGVCLAVPLGHLAEAVLEEDDRRGACLLRSAERTALERCLHVARCNVGVPWAPALAGPLVHHCGSRIASHRAAVRRGVVLLSLVEKGTWASGVVVSEAGHILTCMHFISGTSWMETHSDSTKKPQSAATTGALAATANTVATLTSATGRPQGVLWPSGKTCQGRGRARDRDGRVVDVTFDAEVIYEHPGFLDVALLLVRRGSCRRIDSRERGSSATILAAVRLAADKVARTISDTVPFTFLPLPWSPSAACIPEGANVLSVGHGLFGPGCPWIGPSVSLGHLTVLTRGLATWMPAVVQSSACVHRGCSGGALVVEGDMGWSLLGLVTTNVRTLKDGRVMPRLNFSLPVERLEPLRQYLVDPYREGSLDELAKAWREVAADEEEQRLWRLSAQPLELPSRILARKRHAEDTLQELSKQAEEEALKASTADTAAQPPSRPEVVAARSAL